MSELERTRQAAVPAELVRTDLERFEEVILNQLANVGLPDDGVFVDVVERHRMLSNVGVAIDRLDGSQRASSRYISKMIAAAAAGLFDAALNYLWDETVSELRRRVAGFDLVYFFDIAVKNNDVRKHLKSEDDLTKVDDASLLQAAREIGLLTDVGYQRLDHIRYMRNHASAAHPNQTELTGLDLVSWLETCVIQVIVTPPDTITADTKKLLSNIRQDRLEDDAVGAAAAFFDELPNVRADTLADGFFGLYVSADRTAVVADNVRLLWPELWPYVSEEKRHQYGVRYGRYVASADSDQSKAARELIDLVGATAYLPEAMRVVELDIAIEELRSAHYGWDNFYTEPTPARRLAGLIGDGSAPEAVRGRFVQIVVKAFLGNGHGVASGAEPRYRQMLEGLDADSASMALRSFMDETIASVLFSSVARRQWVKLLDILEPKLIRPTDRDLLDAVRAFPGTPDKLRTDASIQKLAAPPKRRAGTGASRITRVKIR